MRDLWAFRADVTSQGADLSGLAVQAADGGMGKVKEVVDRDSRTFVLIDTGPWIFGKKIKVPAGLVSGIDLDEGVLVVDRSRRQLGSAPGQSGELADDEAHEDALTRYYRLEEAVPPTAARPEPPESESTAPSDRSAEAKPRATERASRVANGRGTDADAPDRDGDQAETPSDPTGGEPPSTPERAGGAEAAPTPTVGAEDGPRSDRPRRHRVRPAAEDKADASPPPERPSNPPARASRRVNATSGERPRTRTASASGRTRAKPSAAKAKARAKAADAPDGKGTETPSRSSEPSRATAKRTERRPKSSGNGQPLARYDAMTAAEVVARLPSLSQSELREVEQYERRGGERQTILKRVAALREEEPWRGYDGANVKEVKAKLATAKADRVTAVRDYERRHRDRAGVMDAARRRLEAL